MTAVEWLIDRLYQHEYHIDILDVAKINGYFEQAKEMEKQQIIDAYSQCGRDNFEHIKVINRSATEYYDDTYGSNSENPNK